MARNIAERYNQLPPISTALRWARRHTLLLEKTLTEIGQVLANHKILDWSVVLVHHHDELDPGEAVQIHHHTGEEDVSVVVPETTVEYPCYLCMDEVGGWSAYEYSAHETHWPREEALQEIANYVAAKNLGRHIGIAYAPYTATKGRIWLETMSEGQRGTTTRLCDYDQEDLSITVTEWRLDDKLRMQPLKAYRSTDAGHVVVGDPPK